MVELVAIASAFGRCGRTVRRSNNINVSGLATTFPATRSNWPACPASSIFLPTCGSPRAAASRCLLATVFSWPRGRLRCLQALHRAILSPRSCHLPRSACRAHGHRGEPSWPAAVHSPRRPAHRRSLFSRTFCLASSIVWCPAWMFINNYKSVAAGKHSDG
jgi:hypothetical protein